MSSLSLLQARRTKYEQGILGLVATGRALSQCTCWQHDAGRIAGLVRLGECIKRMALETADALEQIRELEGRILGPIPDQP